MKGGFKIFLISAIVVFGIIISKGIIYRTLIHYETIGFRTSDEDISLEISRYLLSNLPENQQDISNLIKKALQISANHLHYRIDAKTNSFETCYSQKEAHCVGYSLFFGGVMKFYIQHFNLHEQWEVIHCIGALYFGTWNIHSAFSNPSLKDHDFVKIINKQTGEIIAVDPTLYDYFGIETVKLR